MRKPASLAGDPLDPTDDGPGSAEAASQARRQRADAKQDAGTVAALSELVDAVHGRVVPKRPGAGIDLLLAMLAVALVAPTAALGGAGAAGLPPTERGAVVAALNGLLGDRLATTASPLAVELAFRHRGRRLVFDRDSLRTALPHDGNRLLLSIHDLCGGDLPEDSGHAAALARASGFTPVTLRYASGLHVSTNGRNLARQLELLLHEWPCPIDRFAIVAHGTGGLLARSALHYGRESGHHWLHRLDDLACLGTPHHGTPPGHLGLRPGLLLESTPAAAILARLANLRSPGLTDFEHGNVIDDDWVDGRRLDRATDRRKPVPLPAGPRCYAIAGTIESTTTTPATAATADAPRGDGLVPLASALGRHRLVRRTLKFLPEHQRTFALTDHRALSSSPEISRQLVDWFRH